MSSPKRKAIPKKVRFEVFKRDSFTCQYCGAEAPDVVLHIDHILPVSKGGNNGKLNLVTACQGCNSGKGATLLSDDSAIKRSKRQADDLQGRLEQIEMIAEWQSGLCDLAEKQVDIITDALCSDTDWTLNDSGRMIIRKVLRRFSLQEILAATDISREQYFVRGGEGEIVTWSFEKALGKIGGICWNRKHRDNL